MNNHHPVSQTSHTRRKQTSSVNNHSRSHSPQHQQQEQPFHFETDRRSCLRECCRIKKVIQRQVSAQKLKKRKLFEKNNKNLHHRSVDAMSKADGSSKRISHSSSKLVTISNQEKKKHKRKVYILPHLKSFKEGVLDEPEEVDGLQETDKKNLNKMPIDHEKKHKTCFGHNQNRLRTEVQQQKQALPAIRQFLKGQSYDKISLNHQKTSRAANYSYIDGRSMFKDRTGRRQRQRQISPRSQSSQKYSDQMTNPSKPYYKYIENYPQRQSETTSTPKKHKRVISESMNSLSQTSNKAPGLRDGPTIFHSHKLRFSALKSNSKILQNKEMKIPQTQQELAQYLINYKSIQPTFNVRALVKKDNFDIVPKGEEQVYFGQLQGGIRHGQGILLTKRDVFQGLFKKGQKNQGAQKNRIGTYTGPFKHGKRHGMGKFQWRTGQLFQGQWRQGQKEGHGVWTSTKGSRYQGQWKHNKQNGKGTYHHNGGSTYRGYFKDFLKHGRGQEEFANGDKYVGQYKQGKPHGYGRYIWQNGDQYDGDFSQGSRTGQGKLVHPNGDSYQGSFKDDMKDGQGKQKYGNSGQYLQGTFQRGQIVTGKYYSKQGVVLRSIS